MKLLDRYMLREMFVPFLIGQGAIVLVLVGTMLYNNANVLITNQVPVVFVFRMVLFFLPFLIHMTLPVAVAVGTALAISRLTRDSEITVLRAAGVGLWRIFLPYFIVGALASVADFCIGEYVVPPSIYQLNRVFAELPMHLKKLVPQSGQYIITNDQSYAMMVRQIVPQKGYLQLNDVQIIASPVSTYRGEAQPFVVYAKEGRYENGYWVLKQPTMILYDLKSPNRLEMKPTKDSVFKLYTVVDPQAFQSGLVLQFPMWQIGQTSAMRTFQDMKRDVIRNRKEGVTDYFLLMDYYFKLSVPFACLAMALCCSPMSHRFARAGSFMGVLLSIFLVFFYWNTLLLMRILGAPGMEGKPPMIPPFVAAWLQNILFVFLGLFMLRRSE